MPARPWPAPLHRERSNSTTPNDSSLPTSRMPWVNSASLLPGRAAVSITEFLRAEQNLRAGLATTRADVLEVLLKLGQGDAHQVVHAEHDRHQMRLVGEHIAIESSQRSARRITADACIAHRHLRLWINLVERDLQHLWVSAHPAAVVIDSGNAVADADDLHGLLARGEKLRGFLRSRSDQTPTREPENEEQKPMERVHG